jgi:hypothetical protein
MWQTYPADWVVVALQSQLLTDRASEGFRVRAIGVCFIGVQIFSASHDFL